jgi:hypothetical protein
MGWDATSEDVEKAKAEVKKALEASPIEAAWGELRQIKERALEPIKADVAERKAKKERTRCAENQATRYLPHIDTYLRHLERDEDYAFDDRWRLAKELEEDLRPLLTDELVAHPDRGEDEAQAFIENFIHDEID